MNKDELLKFCEEVGPVFSSTPFAKMENGSPTIVVRHLKNQKSFAYLSERENQLIVAVKQKPELSEELREHFKDLNLAWHMNKTHWNDIRVGGDVSDDLIRQMILQSYDLIKPKK